MPNTNDILPFPQADHSERDDLFAQLDTHPENNFLSDKVQADHEADVRLFDPLTPKQLIEDAKTRTSKQYRQLGIGFHEVPPPFPS